jgi:uracil-DNA glycosylase
LEKLKEFDCGHKRRIPRKAWKFERRTAAHALMGRTVTLARERGRLLQWSDGVAGCATIHPSAVLRKRDDNSRKQEFDGLISDLLLARRLAETL